MAKNKKILLIDDDKKATDALMKKLEKEGFTVFSAENGEKGIELAFSKKPDLILLDIIMPGKHGVEVMNSLKADKWGRNVPVIVLSGYPDYPGLDELMDEYEYEIVGKDETHFKDLLDKVNKEISNNNL